MSNQQRLLGTVLCLVPTLLVATPAHVLEFDEAQLRRRGLDPAMARYFAQAPRFAPGSQRVSLQLNGRSLGKVLVRFNEHGELCFDDRFLHDAGLKLPGTQRKVPERDTCHDFIKAYPTTQVDLQPTDEAISLIVSQQALTGLEGAPGQYARGGTAGLLNYDLYGSRQDSPWGTSEQLFASTELGLNAGDWALRSRQSLSRSSNETHPSGCIRMPRTLFLAPVPCFNWGK
jgi:outer membrane usher protein FimD/PapC